MFAMVGKDPGPHRHWQPHSPFARIVPTPLARAPGEPTAGAAAERSLVNVAVLDIRFTHLL